MLTKPFFKILSLSLTIAVFILTLPAQGWAMFIPSGSAALDRAADMGRIQSTLESAALKQRLMDYGLTPEEAVAKLSALTDGQIHELAAHMDSLQAGGDGLGTIIFLLLVAVIVIVVLQATGHEVIIKK